MPNLVNMTRFQSQGFFIRYWHSRITTLFQIHISTFNKIIIQQLYSTKEQNKSEAICGPNHKIYDIKRQRTRITSVKQWTVTS